MTIWHVPKNYLTTVWWLPDNNLMTAWRLSWQLHLGISSNVMIAVMLKLCCFIRFEIRDNDKNYDLIMLPSAARSLKTAKINYIITCSYFEHLNQLPSFFLFFWSHKWQKNKVKYNSPTISYKIISVCIQKFCPIKTFTNHWLNYIFRSSLAYA